MTSWRRLVFLTLGIGTGVVVWLALLLPTVLFAVVMVGAIAYTIGQLQG